ncbi:DNA-binding CsgD family transcriptional regulator [Wenyingzhuangia heitensis]|uniref:DNA-binding CsgD family transcriptional regulator n=1 Tax=Wenyingzhuangia heitensis TaxID=1487859 RepID=A0ABX0UEF9_9FLAO|nr:hypothetical protein [Wenyingzhuangia heitensis]NIJ45836.1 DNA-binding CsgD family transcriptional regulator [Wenyingzhuangia heitensis]
MITLLLCYSVKTHSINSPYPDSKIFKSTKKDSTILVLENAIETSSNIKTNKKHIQLKIQLIERMSGIGEYHKAYQLLNELTSNLKNSEFTNLKVELLSKLSILYLILDQNKKANDLFYSNFDSLYIEAKQKKDSIKITRKLLRLQASIESNANENYLKAEKVLLQSIAINSYNKQDSLSGDYCKLYLGELYTKMYLFDKAETQFLEIEKKYTATNQHILTLLYFYKGQFYHKKKNTESSIEYFEKSLQKMDSQNQHIDLTIKTMESLSELYFQKEDYKNAYALLSRSKTLNEQLFGSRSEQNKELFDIRDEHSKELQKQKMMLLKKEKNVLVFKSALYISVLIAIILMLLFYFIRKNKLENTKQQLLKATQEIEIKNKEEVLELKNRELLSSAMQVIEKDGMLEDIKKQLKALEFNKENSPYIKQIIQSLKINRSKKWEEFNTHFTTLNHNYFNLLKQRYPTLTKTDLKICAFIKLGFSSKEIAQITGLGVDSVNTTRSRLRKKLELNRSIVLINFLQNFDNKDF